MIRFLGLATVTLALMYDVCAATLTDEQQGRLLQTLSAMGAAPLTEESRELCDYVMREELDLEDRMT